MDAVTPDITVCFSMVTLHLRYIARFGLMKQKVGLLSFITINLFSLKS